MSNCGVVHLTETVGVISTMSLTAWSFCCSNSWWYFNWLLRGNVASDLKAPAASINTFQAAITRSINEAVVNRQFTSSNICFLYSYILYNDILCYQKLVSIYSYECHVMLVFPLNIAHYYSGQYLQFPNPLPLFSLQSRLFARLLAYPPISSRS